MNLVSEWTNTLMSRLGSAPVILEIDLDRGVLSAGPDSPLAALRAVNSPSMAALREGLREAAKDDRVRGLILLVGTCPLTAAQIDDLGDLIEQFGESKPTAAFAPTFGEFNNGLPGYRLAVRAGEVWVQPAGSLALAGAHLEVTLLRGGLEKLDIEPQFGQRKEYKTAGDRFAATEVTASNREMVSRIGQSVVDAGVAVIARCRSLDPDKVWDAINNTPTSADEALTLGLVDAVGYRDEFYSTLRERWGVPEQEDNPGLRFVHRHGDHTPFQRLARMADRSKPVVGVVSLRGGIVTGRSQPSPLSGPQSGSGEVCDQLRAAARDPHVKAVVLRVDSPGGSAIASDEIRRAVHRVRATGKPVVASMGDVAASGGYYVSMGADEIVASPSTLTGSIGVVAGKFVTQGLYDKLGLIREGIDIGARAGMVSGVAGFTEDEWDVLNRQLDMIYADFTGKAAADRDMDISDLEPLARGRVWTGSDAQERGLIDHLGGMDVALDRACVLADLDRDDVHVRPIPSIPLLARLRPALSTESLNGAARASSVAAVEGWTRVLGSASPLETLLAHLGAPGVLTMPWQVRIR